MLLVMVNIVIMHCSQIEFKKTWLGINFKLKLTSYTYMYTIDLLLDDRTGSQLPNVQEY